MSFTVHHQDTLEAHADTSVPDPHQDTFSKTILGFWIYLMTDCLLFATLFATYAVLHNNTFGGPSSQDLFNLTTPFIETMILLFSSVTCGLALLYSLKNKTNKVLAWLAVSFLLGATFVAIELHEFRGLVLEGNSWERSAFLSSFFTLVGTHGLHVSFGLLWMGVMMAQIYFDGITTFTFRRLVTFGLFWHFLDLVWIFIFTFVYLIGV
jgi:cytochrome o ubiquinol oxidase subunit 3